MDPREQLAALSLGNAPHEDTIGATAVEILFYHRIAFSHQEGYCLSGSPGSRRSMHRELPEQVRGGSMRSPGSSTELTTQGGHHTWNADGTASFEVLA